MERYSRQSRGVNRSHKEEYDPLKTLATRIDKSEVHVVRTENLWLRSGRETSDAALRCEFVIPASAYTFRFSDLLEVQRQVGLVQSHRQLGVPKTDVFVLNAIELIVDRLPSSSVMDVSGVVDATFSSVRSGAARTRSADQDFALRIDEGISGSGSSKASFIPRVAYERLRQQLGRSRPGSHDANLGREAIPLALSAGASRLPDHSSDHISAIALVSGIENAIERTLGARLNGLSMKFVSYAEARGESLQLQLAHHDDSHFRGTVTQFGAVCAIARGHFDSVHDDD